MTKLHAFFLLALGSLFASACQHSGLETRRSVSLVVRDVTVIDPERTSVRPHQSVFIDGGKIVAVLPSERARRYQAAHTIEGSGRFLIPGLMDMHFHLFLPEPPTPNLHLLLANGVTGIRDMSSDCWELAGARTGCVAEYKDLRAALEAGDIAGPKLLSLASAMVFGPSRLQVPDGTDPFIAPRTPEEARRLVRYLKSRGIDRIKTHDSIPREAFFALMDEARSLGLTVSGHVPFSAGSLGASRAGYASIEHARDLVYDCSRYGPELRRTMTEVTEQRPGAAAPKNIVRLKRSVEEFDRQVCAMFLAQLARTGVYYVPTHVTREMEARAGEPAYRADPNRKYIISSRNKVWEKDLDETAAVPADESAALKAFFEHGLEITRLAHQAGVPIMAGTDASDTMIVPGFSLHRELALLVRAGLPPMDALRSATTIPARHLRQSELYGGISPGKQADLVLLNANPLKDVRNMGLIEAVISSGRVFDRATLDTLLIGAEKAAATS